MDSLFVPETLLERICAAMPAFRLWWHEETEGDGGSYSLHAVYRSFFTFLHRMEPSAVEVQAVARLLNEAVAAGGDSENAVGTCFLEHLGPRSEVRRLLWPLLSRAAKRSSVP